MTIEKLREAFDDMLVAEVKRHGGIPHLSPEDMRFREAVAELLAENPEPTDGGTTSLREQNSAEATSVQTSAAAGS